MRWCVESWRDMTWVRSSAWFGTRGEARDHLAQFGPLNGRIRQERVY